MSQADANAGGGGTFVWSSIDQGHILTAFFYGYVVTQIPFGILSKKYGAKYFLGIGMLINSLFAFLVPLAANHHIVSLCGIRFIQGLGEVSLGGLLFIYYFHFKNLNNPYFYSLLTTVWLIYFKYTCFVYIYIFFPIYLFLRIEQKYD